MFNQCNSIVKHIVLLTLVISAGINCYAKSYPWLSPNEYRVLFTIKKPRAQWQTVPVSYSLDLRQICKQLDLSSKEINLSSIRIIAYDKNSNPMIQRADRNEDERYYIPYRLNDDLFPSQVTISWRVRINHVHCFSIYFDRNDHGIQEPMTELPVVGNGDYLSYGQRGVVGPISGGYNETVAAGDGDGDGDLDLFVGFCGVGEKGGIYFFENKGSATVPLLVAGKRIYPYNQPFQLIDWDSDGKVEILILGELYKLQLYPHPVTQHYKTVLKAVDSSAKLVDWDSDGLSDLLSAQALNRSYYPSSATWDYNEPPYSSLGVWLGENPRSTITFSKNIGSQQNDKFAEPTVLLANHVPLELYGTLSFTAGDWDNDGDLDLLVGDSFELIFFENAGSQLKKGVILKTQDDQDPFSIYVRPELADWDGDGDLDVLLGNEDGRPTWIENLGNGKLAQERFLIQSNPDIDAGCSSVPVVRDWDADGDLDLICGNSTGYVEYFENKSSAPTKFVFNSGQRLKADNKEIRIFAYNSGSIQGPDEAKYGYTMPEVADWDGDGDLDLLLSDVKGEHHFYENSGNTNAPQLKAGVPLLVDWQGKPPKPSWVWWQPQQTELVTQWRCRPAAVDWNRDGLVDYVAVDHEGFLAYYQAFLKNGEHWLLPGKRIFQDEHGMPIRISELAGGRSGRARIVMADWDNDGDLDIIHNAHNLFDDAMAFLKQVKNAGWFENIGTMEKPVFIWRGELFKRDILRTSAHSTSPEPIDFDGDGKLDLFLGGEDGKISCYHRAFIEDDLPELSLQKIEEKSAH
jgi:hypothetical protein